MTNAEIIFVESQRLAKEGRGEARKSILRSTSVSLMTFAFLLRVF